MSPKYCRVPGYGLIIFGLLVAGWLGTPPKVARASSNVDDSTFPAQGDSTHVASATANGTGFGDTTWTAPDPPGSEDPSQPGPRVAEPDHDPGWETALRTPFRAVFFPMRLLARGMELGFKQFGDQLLEPKPPSPGVKVGLAIYAGSTNDVALGPDIKARDVLFPNSRFHLFAGWSITDHRRVRLTETIADRRPLGFRLAGNYDLKPNHRFYGIGNDTPENQLSYFRLEDTFAEAALLVGSKPLRQIRFVADYSGMNAKSGWHGTPLLEDVLLPEQAPGYAGSTFDLGFGVTGDLGLVNNDVSPSLGVHAKTELRRFRGVRDSDPDYDQWLVEGRGYVPVFAHRRVIAVKTVWAGVKPTDSSPEMPFYRLARNEGALAFEGYHAFRYYDNQLAIARAEYRWQLWDRQDWTLSAVALYELNEVAPFASAFTWDKRHHAYGGGLRLSLTDRSAVRLDLAKSTEGLHLILSMGNVF